MTGVLRLVDEPLVEKLLKNLADDFLMALLSRADEVAVMDAEAFPEFLETDHGFVAVRERSHVALFRCFLYLLPVFVGSGQEESVLSHCRMETGQDIRQHGCVGVSYMRFVIDIIDRCGYIIVFRHVGLLSFFIGP